MKRAVFEKILNIGIFGAIGFYIYHFFFFWMFESTDSYFYWLLSNYIKTGQYLAIPPYYYSVPSTMEPPFYSLILYFIQWLPRSDIFIHLFQVAAILFSAYFLFIILKAPIGRNRAKLTALFFLLIPGNILYISNLVAEPIAVFLISLFLILFYKISVEKKRFLLPLLFPISAIMALQRYNLILFFGTITLYFLFLKQKKWVEYISFGIGISILIIWVLINHQMNGSWGFSNSEGKHLYNRILHFDKLIPKDNDPAFVEFKNIVGEGIDYFKPWWFYEPLLMQKFQSETESSHLMQRVSLAALKTDPMRYVLNTIPFFIFAHASNPTYHDQLYRWSGSMPQFCRTLGGFSFCKPIISSSSSYKVWDLLVNITDWYYLNISPLINFCILFPALLYAVFQKKTFFRICALLYISSILFFVLVEAPLPRYTYIFHPLKFLVMSVFLTDIIKRGNQLYLKRFRAYK